MWGTGTTRFFQFFPNLIWWKTVQQVASARKTVCDTYVTVLGRQMEEITSRSKSFAQSVGCLGKGEIWRICQLLNSQLASSLTLPGKNAGIVLQYSVQTPGEEL